MELTDKLGIGTAILAGSSKGFADATGIDLHGIGYLLPVIGVLTLPGAGLADEQELKEGRYWLGDIFLGGIITGASYVLGKTAGYFVNHYS